MNRGHGGRALLLAAVGTCVALAVTATAGTYALFSDFDTATGNRVAAASVFLGPGATDDLALTYPPLEVGVRAEGTLTVDYAGTVAADVTLGLDPGRATAFCEQGPEGWHNVTGLALTITIGAASPVSYCSLLDAEPVLLAAAVEPGSEAFTTAVDLTLTENTLTGTEPITAVDALVVEARGGFTDRAQGTLTAPVEPEPPLSPTQQQAAAAVSAAPPALAAAVRTASADPAAVLDPDVVPEECRGRGFRPDQVVLLTPEDVPWTADEARGVDTDPLLIFGTDGDDDVTGSAEGDCIVGGDGADRLLGKGGDDALLGGDGVDRLDGGLGDDLLFGGAGLDTLVGGEGVDRFDGGVDRAICDGGVDGRTTGPRCDPPVVATVAPPPVTTPAPPPTTVPAPTTVPPAEVVPPPSATTTGPPPVTTTSPPAPATVDNPEVPPEDAGGPEAMPSSPSAVGSAPTETKEPTVDVA